MKGNLGGMFAETFGCVSRAIEPRSSETALDWLSVAAGHLAWKYLLEWQAEVGRRSPCIKVSLRDGHTPA